MIINTVEDFKMSLNVLLNTIIYYYLQYLGYRAFKEERYLKITYIYIYIYIYFYELNVIILNI